MCADAGGQQQAIRRHSPSGQPLFPPNCQRVACAVRGLLAGPIRLAGGGLSLLCIRQYFDDQGEFR